MNLFLCSTPTQIVNALILTKNSLNEPTDICIFDFIDDCISMSKKLSETRIFRNVHLINVKTRYYIGEENRFNKLSKSFKKIFNAVFSRAIIRYLPNKDVIYQNVFISGPDLVTQLIYYHFHKINRQVSLNLFEEGIYTYYVFGRKPHKTRWLISWILFHRYFWNDITTVYVYHKELVDNTAKKDVIIKQIPKPIIDKPNDVLDVLNGFFVNDVIPSTFDKRFIFLDTSFLNEEYERRQKEIVSLIKNIVGNDNLLIKLHPRSDMYKYGDLKNVVKTRNTLEMIGLKVDFTNSVFLSIYSSAAFGMKLMFDIEPFVILLYKLDETIRKEYSTFGIAEKIMQLYKSEKFFMPENSDEVALIINDISNERAVS